MHVPRGLLLSVDSCLRWWLQRPLPASSNQVVGWDIARDLALRGLVASAELRGRPGKRLLEAALAAGLRVVVERESMGIKWVRFERDADGKDR